MLAFVDQSGTPDPKGPDKGAVLAALCMRESTYLDIEGAVYSIKKAYKWFNGGLPKELHATNCANQRAWAKRNRGGSILWKMFLKTLRAALSADVVVFAIMLDRPSKKPGYPPHELPSQYFFLLKQVQSLACRWREANATVVFDEENRKEDVNRAFAFARLVRSYWEGFYFDRIITVPLFGNSEGNHGLQLVDLAAYTIFIDEYARLRDPSPREDYLKAIHQLRCEIEKKTIKLRDFHTKETLEGFYRMPGDLFYRRPSEPLKPPPIA